MLFGCGGEGEEGEEGENDEDEQQPSVSLVSFLWAHSLVRSRALDLRVVGGGGGGDGEGTGGGGEVCLLPLIDLAQHDDGKGGGGGGGGTGSAPATLRLVSSPSSSSSSPSSPPAAVELVAGASAIPKGAPICLNYGSRPLRDLLRGYAFVPKVPRPPPVSSSPPPPPPPSLLSPRASEIFEDFSSSSLASRAALVVDASASCCSGAFPPLLHLASVRLLARPGGEDAALEFGRARVVFVVEVGCGGGGGTGGGGSSSGSSVNSSPVVFTATEEELPMQPEAEVGVCRWVARECEELASEIEGWEKEKKPEKGDGETAAEKRPSSSSSSSWLSKAAEELASDYRAARVSLLRRCSESLEAQAWLVESSLGGAL